MFNADDARRQVADFFAKGEEASQTWVVKNLQDALTAVMKAANVGECQIEYKVCVEMEKFSIVKKKLLMHALMRQGFHVSVSESNRPSLMKVFTVFTISWT